MNIPDRPPTPLDRPLESDELADLLAWVLLYPPINPSQDWLELADFPTKATYEGGQPPKNLQGFLKANGGNEALLRRVNETCWEWVRAGLIVPWEPRGFTATARGRETLADTAAEGQALVRSWLVRRLAEIDGVDDLTLFYAGEAHEAFLAGLYQSSAVMMGVATEWTLLTLSQELSERRKLFSLQPLPRRANAFGVLEWVRAAFEDQRLEIRAAIKNAGGSARWIDEIPGFLAAGNAIRLTRNETGHPTGVRVERDQVLALLPLFVPLVESLVVTTTAIARTPAD